eukprot:TRINITY_DN12175_c0_g1_i1.p1 TRINITY_DN12175_c0_g1~~TRINITY_DN12175_c0_g1_i1.p1  ORF type:complete len:685 (-),score=164.75 TRINITY_DN12175_c0_g1_i1:39-2051(-)
MLSFQPGEVPCYILLSGIQVPRVIGKAGAIIKELRQESGATINILDKQVPEALQLQQLQVAFAKGSTASLQVAVTGLVRNARGPQALRALEQAEHGDLESEISFLVPEKCEAYLGDEQLVSGTNCSLVAEPIEGVRRHRRVRLRGEETHDVQVVAWRLQELQLRLFQAAQLTDRDFELQDSSWDDAMAAFRSKRTTTQAMPEAAAPLVPLDRLPALAASNGSDLEAEARKARELQHREQEAQNEKERKRILRETAAREMQECQNASREAKLQEDKARELRHRASEVMGDERQREQLLREAADCDERAAEAKSRSMRGYGVGPRVGGHGREVQGDIYEKSAMEREAKEREANERAAAEKHAKEREARDQLARQREARDREAREKQDRERETRAQAGYSVTGREVVSEQQTRQHDYQDWLERESRERDNREREIREARDRENRERETQDQQDREREIREARERETRERETREQQNRDREISEALTRKAREREALERQSRDREIHEVREREAREREVREREAREREVREREAREREAREREARERQNREHEMRLAQEQHIREREAREAWERDVREQQKREQQEARIPAAQSGKVPISLATGEVALMVKAPSLEAAHFLASSHLGIGRRTGTRISVGDPSVLGLPALEIWGTPAANAAASYLVQEALWMSGVFC